ncbi:histidine phosphatase family protein [Amycolatopsis aidingensis]|uniref:histidine phosphatase family protein n=1 Tax=Amycolatopsis aidingensis TaxID=2842453 RepID=UPI001C0BEA10|nr:histidine phosphatase family protein [Amycolatopsis aidingensis]
MGAIYLIRHGQASFGAADYDVLSEQGTVQSTAVGAELRRRGARIAEARCGSLLRQRATAAAALAELGGDLSAKEDPRWNEYDHLDVLAQHGTPVRQRDPREFQAALDAALRAWTKAGTGSPCVESWPAFGSRVRAAVTELAAALGKGEQAVVFTSGGVIAALAADLLGGGAESFLFLNRVTANAGITKLVAGQSGLSLLSFNEHAHFESTSLLSYR